MPRLKTRMRRWRQRDVGSGLTKAERRDWTKEWQGEMQMWDRVGLVVSGLCMVHCVAMPMLFAFAPTASRLFGNFNAHAWLAGISLFIAFATFIPSFLQHRHRGVLTLALTGLSIIALAAINDDCCQPASNNGCTLCRTEQACPHVGGTPTSDGPDVGVRTTNTDRSQPANATASDLSWASLWRRWQTPFGGALLAIAHVLNARLRRRCCGACREKVFAEPEPQAFGVL